MRVRWTEIAFAQLDEAMGHIAEHRPETASRWFKAVRDAAGGLSKFPDSGRMVPEVSRQEIREIVVSPYRIIYRRDHDAVYITMFLHERQQLGSDDLG